MDPARASGDFGAVGKFDPVGKSGYLALAASGSAWLMAGPSGRLEGVVNPWQDRPNNRFVKLTIADSEAIGANA